MAKLLLSEPLSDVLQTEAVTSELNEQVKTCKDWQQFLNVMNLQVTIKRQLGDGNSPVRTTDEVAFISHAALI